MTLRGRWYATNDGIELEIDSDGTIVDIKSYAANESDPYISPGFFDVQVNGFRGIDYSSEALTVDQVYEITDYLKATGTTRHVPTIISNAKEKVSRNLQIIRKAVRSSDYLGYAIPAVHLEGPYVSEVDGPRGAHDKTYVREPSIDEYRQWRDSSGGLLKIVTLAPERDGAIPFIKQLSEDGILVGIGHTGAEPETIQKAVEAGAGMSTHLGNGSHAVLPRLRNYIWEQLAADELYAGIISDGFHLPKSVLKVFYRAKGAERIVLISDVGPMGGQKPGLYKWGNIDVEVHPDGHLGLAGTEFLAGAGHLLDRGIAQFINASNCSIAEAIQACTVNPSTLLKSTSMGKRDEYTYPKKGMPADLVQFSFNAGENQLTILEVVSGKKGR